VILFPLGEKFRRISPGQQTDGASCSFEVLTIFSTFSRDHTAFHKADQVHPENFSEFVLIVSELQMEQVVRACHPAEDEKPLDEGRIGSDKKCMQKSRRRKFDGFWE
jgi:hypothetical protein